MRKLKFIVGLIVILVIINSVQGQDLQGCFLCDFQPKTAVIPPYENYTQTASSPTVIVNVNFKDTVSKVSNYIYGNNANVYMSQMVTEPVLLDHIRALSPNIIRFPGGNLSSLFFWDAAPGYPPVDVPDSLVNSEGQKEKAWYWYGKNNESWTLSVDNYYKMLDSTNNTGMITINYGYARYGTGPHPAQTAAGHAADWIRYDNGRTKFWEIGNESAGPWQAGFRIDTSMNQDNQPVIVSGELYGEHFKIFADSMKTAASEIGAEIYIGAQLIQYDAEYSWNPPERDWNEGFFKIAGNYADFFIIHTYYTPYNQNSTAEVILNSAATETAGMMNWLKTSAGTTGANMKPVALTEWNIFAIGSKQSCSFINGMHATLVLGELAKYQYGMASRWDLANGYDNGDDHGMFNIGDEPGVPKWNPRPAFFYMYYFQKFFGDHMLSSSVAGSDNIVAYTSGFSSQELGLVVVNKGTSDETIKLYIPDFGYGDRYYMYSLTGGIENGEFSQIVNVNDYGPDNTTGGPIDNLENLKAWSAVIEKSILFNSPGRSVQFILIESGDKYISNYNPVKQRILSIYPNPANGKCILELPHGITNIEILDITGRIVYSEEINLYQPTITLALDYIAGLFVAKAYSGKDVFIKKILVR